MRYNTNPAFWRALHSLAHPVSLTAVLLLLLNDHWLRWHYPSWLTGKLGDFTWLLFAPFIAAAGLAWVLPCSRSGGHDVSCPYSKRRIHHEQIVGLTAFAFIGLWFALAKTVPAVHGLTVQAWETIIGWRGSLRMDASDLLTLPALLLGWWVWTRSGNTPLNLRPLAWVALGLGVVATLASDGPIYSYADYGVTQICEKDRQIAFAVPDGARVIPIPNSKNPDGEFDIFPLVNVFTSSDGGMTWSSEQKEESQVTGLICSNKDGKIVDPNNPSIQYRWIPGDKIERSIDGGTSWLLENDLIEQKQDIRVYYNHQNDFGDTFSGYTRRFKPGPLDAAIDSVSGNALFAMSWDGILIRKPEGTWHWVKIGQYELADITRPQKLSIILLDELWVAFAIASLIATYSTAYMRQRTIIGRWRVLSILVGITWMVWILSSNLGSTYESSSDQILFIVPSLPLLIIALPLSIGAVWDIARNFRSLWRKIAVAAVGVSLLFLVPFIPWTQGTIPRYTTALAFALVLAMCGLIAGGMYLRRVLPVLPKPEPQPPAANMTPDQSS